MGIRIRTMFRLLIITAFLGLPVLGLPDTKDFCIPFDLTQTCCFTPAEFGWVGDWFEQQVLHGIIENLDLDPVMVEAGEKSEEHGYYKAVWEAFEFFGLDNLSTEPTATLICTRGWTMNLNAELTLGTGNGGASDGFMADVPLEIFLANLPVALPLPYPTSIFIPDIRIQFSAFVKVNPLDCGGERMVINDLYISDIHGARIEGWPDATGTWLAGAQDAIAYKMATSMNDDLLKNAQSHVDGNNYICDLCGNDMGIPLPWC